MRRSFRLPLLLAVLSLSSASVTRAEPSAPPAGGQPAAGGSSLARVLLLPDISAVGSFAAAYDDYDVERLSPREGPFGPKDKPTPRFEELEVGLQSVVDHWARADVFIAFTPDEVAVEEAYVSSLGLPLGLHLRVGKMFSPFGRQNQQHPHAWEFVDVPLGRTRLLADEVLSGPGLEVGWLAPLPWFLELRVAGQGTAPTPTDEDPGERLTAVARLLQYVSLSDATTVGVGLSAGRRSEATGAFRDLGGADVYVRWRPPASRSFVSLQAEYFTRRFRTGGLSGGHRETMPLLVEAGDRGREEGGYAQLFVKHGAHVGWGLRYDQAPSAGESERGTERRYSALAALFPSEFQRIRLQASWDRRPGGQEGLEVLLGAEFGIGSHGAHPF